MITNISKLKNWGIFQDYSQAKDLPAFTKYNLFYGWNGSGKSTLTKVFFSLADKTTHNHFAHAEYTILSDSCPDITQKNISSNPINIRVFNRDFIERNVNFEQSKANSILILSQEKQEELQHYKDALIAQQTKESSLKTANGSYEQQTEDLKKNLSKWASNVKKSFELIETSNNYYLNYDRTKLSAFIKNHGANIIKESILTAIEVRDLKNVIKPSRKPDIDNEQFELIDIEELVSKSEGLRQILSKSVYAIQIKRLVENPQLNSWVEEGLELHQTLESKRCEYCHQILPDARVEELNKHFSADYKTLMEELKGIAEYIQLVTEKLNVKIIELLELYEEFQEEYSLIKDTYLTSIQNCNDQLLTLITWVDKKIASPFETIVCKFDDLQDEFYQLNNCKTRMYDLVVKHNLKNQSFDDIVKNGQHKLELHFVTEQLLKENYFTLESKIKTIMQERDRLSGEVKIAKEIVFSFEAALLNEVIGADTFNKSLAKFLGRSDIALQFDKGLKGYKLIRGKNTTPANNLSEGEKTAIAFVYFIAKLKENGNLIENSIIVVDDPISSFDSNHLFHSYSYLKMECEKAEQIFILTHNFQYFKLIRDWLLKKNEVKFVDNKRVEKIRSRFYSIECSSEPDREALIKIANDTLIKFNSEYHYVFHKLHELKGIPELDVEKAFLISNLSRKLLEAFLTFKFPRGRNDFSQLLQAGCSDPEIREKVYRFINKYSHNQQIDFHDTPIDNLLGEGNNIVNDVFKIVEDLDENHFKEMQELVTV